MVESEDDVAETAEAAKEVVEEDAIVCSLFFVSKSWVGILYCCNFLLILVEDLTA